MNHRALTRREFFWALVSPRFAVGNIATALICVAMLFLLSAMLPEAKSVRFWSNLRGLGILCGIGLTLWLVARLVAAFKERSRNFPPALAALTAVVGQLVNFAASAAGGAYLYVRWKNGDDLVGVAISLGVFAGLHFRNEWRKLSESKPPSSDSERTPR
jgi:hypothetical protein